MVKAGRKKRVVQDNRFIISNPLDVLHLARGHVDQGRCCRYAFLGSWLSRPKADQTPQPEYAKNHNNLSATQNKSVTHVLPSKPQGQVKNYLKLSVVDLIAWVGELRSVMLRQAHIIQLSRVRTLWPAQGSLQIIAVGVLARRAKGLHGSALNLRNT